MLKIKVRVYKVKITQNGAKGHIYVPDWLPKASFKLCRERTGLELDKKPTKVLKLPMQYFELYNKVVINDDAYYWDNIDLEDGFDHG